MIGVILEGGDISHNPRLCVFDHIPTEAVNLVETRPLNHLYIIFDIIVRGILNAILKCWGFRGGPFIGIPPPKTSSQHPALLYLGTRQLYYTAVVRDAQNIKYSEY